MELKVDIALNAAKLSLEHFMPMAGSIILATARQYGAIIWTQDADSKDIKEAKYFPKK